MVEQESMKVYELAKELGLDSIALLDKLNGLNIKVKNHMSELNPSDVNLARSSLITKAKAAAEKKSSAAPRVRKKTTTSAAAETKEAAAPAEKKTAAAKEAATAAAATTKAGASPIIRRRVKADGAMETVSTGLPTRSPEAEAQNEVPAEMPQEEILAATDAPTEAEVETRPATSTETPAANATPTTTAAPPPPRPQMIRRSILKVVEPTAPIRPNVIAKPDPAAAAKDPKSAVKGTATQDKDGFRIIRMTKENLDQMVEEEAAKKRGGGGREAEIRPEDVRFADYRKKEMVFLPKKKRIPVGKEIKRTQLTTMKASKRVVEMGETISVGELANQLNVKANDIIRKLMGMGQMATINQALDMDTATLIAHEYQFEVKNITFKEAEFLDSAQDTAEQLQSRPPIVTIMGHVDHGKTSLLDAIRDANVAAGEAGGITQHIGAYTIQKDGKFVTFIDTPGHEAFTVMRARGANVTDIVVLVVAADDGVMPQTREALSHAQAAGVPIIVAVNKIDKPQANPEKVKQALAELNVLAEDWGGQTMFVPVSATKKTGLDKLVEAILLQAEVLDLKSNPEARASGTVLEARLEKGRGPVVSLLVKRGTLKIGDAVVVGTIVGRVKAMLDYQGRSLKETAPGYAVEVLGFEAVPNAGDRFDSPASETDARKIADSRQETIRAKAIAAGQVKVSLDDLFSKIQAGQIKELGVVLKADVFGSLEAIRDSLSKLATEKVKVKIIHAAPGGITESDVMLASASGGVIIGFNVRPETKARQLAEAEHIDIKSYTIIYELIEDIKKAMTGLLDKKKVEKFLGRAEVRQTFSVPKIGTIAGCSVIDGKMLRGANVRLLRDSRVIFDGKMSSLKRFKDDAKEVAQGFECGIGIENYNDVKTGDIIEAYQIDLIAPELNE